MEHRWGERSRLNVPVQVDCGSRGVVLGVMRDASASGAFLCTAAQLPLLTCVRVEFSRAPGVAQPQGVHAHVVRRAADGFGLEWTEQAPDTIVDLLRTPRATPATQQARVGSVAVSAPPIAVDVRTLPAANHTVEEIVAR